MGATDFPWIRKIAAVASLGEENRRALYQYVLASGEAVGRDQAATALGLSRSTASFHLDRLVDDGLLRAEFKRPGGKTGPGSGRPAKLYRPTLDEVGASVPQRSYDLAGHLMASAIAHSAAEGVPVSHALLDVADASGREAGRSGDFIGALADCGYQPTPDDAGGYRLLNCPFHRLSRDHSEVVCPMNGAFLRGVAVTSGADPSTVVGDTGPGHCCARITRHIDDSGHDAAR
ncbi:transcriptional regulator [Paenarthrobacter sp. AR 02]|uniref:helix-turn-helix transcriptional regulator n=1 Tax=Micrococcaceae TaxID=1268 RepID=UPI001F22870E|nr:MULTISPECIES: helix-turn-helix domain-containing protein [Micrococcaceae]MCF3140245.1 transcriptional regulator [Paenarthrobacter sp. AR 02]